MPKQKTTKIPSKFITPTILKFKLRWWTIALVTLLVLGVMSAIVDAVSENDQVQNNKEERDYQTLCANGNFVEARVVQNRLYEEYTKVLGRWRSGEWCGREARQKQEEYRSVAAYIFGQEISSIYYSEEPKRNEKLISLLISIPTEGAPLAEGVHGEGMFYDNDAGVGEPLAIDHMVYQSWVRFYNDRCEQLLNLGLANDDTVLIRKVAGLFKADVNTTFQQDTVRGGDYRIATVSYDATRRNKAIEQSMVKH